MKISALKLLTIPQVRAARALLAWSQQKLAKEAGVGISTVADFERGDRTPVEKSVEAMRAAFEKAGVTFLPGGAIKGPPLPALSRQPTRNGLPIKWITVTDLKQWADRKDSQSTFPELIAKLIRATTGYAAHIAFQQDESTATEGWDGTCYVAAGTEHVPSGQSGWELSTQAGGITGKADKDYAKRSKNPLGLNPTKSTYVFATLRTWNEKEKWVREHRAEHLWADVRALDADDLVHWIELNPAVGHWLAVKIGKYPPGLRQLDEVWDEWSLSTKWPLSADLVLAGRDDEMIAVLNWLREEPSAFHLQAELPEEAIAFLHAVLHLLPREYCATYDARCLVASSEESARALGDSISPLIIVLDSAEPGLANRLASRGHHVFVAYGSDTDTPDDVRRLSRPLRTQIQAALKTMDVPDEMNERLSNDSGRSLAVLRRLMEPATPKPAWAAAPTRGLIAAVLVGCWDEDNADDKSVLERISGLRYEEIALELAPLVGVLDTPLRKVGKTWKVASRQDAWFRLARNITSAQFDAFLSVTSDVLSTLDPRYDMDPDDRWLAGIKNVRAKYSGLVRRGLTETLILASLFGNRAPNVTEPAGKVSHVIRTVMESADAKGWWSLSRSLRALSEASPDAFMSAVDKSLQSTDKPITALFGQDGGVFGGEHLSDLLWALESLAWNPQYLSRVATLLAELDKIDPGGRYSNRPANSLRHIFLVWFPQTYTPLEGRMRVIDRLRSTHSDQAWKLMLDLLPGNHQVASNNPHPYWRDYGIEESETVTYGLIDQGGKEVTRRLLEDVGTNARRWVDVIGFVANLDPGMRSDVIGTLMSTSADITGAEDRRMIWDKLRHVLHQHRELAEAEWALPEKELKFIEQVYERFTPADIVEKWLWIFQHNPEIPHPKPGDYDGNDKAVVNLQEQAVKEILASRGFDGLLQLAAQVDLGGFIGRALTAIPGGDAHYENAYRRALPSEDPRVSNIAHGLIHVLGRVEGQSWADALVRRSVAEKWGTDATVKILKALPVKEETWKLAAEAGPECETAYWKTQDAYWVEGNTNQIIMAAEHLLKAGRARHAIALIGHYRKKEFPSELLVRALRQAVTEPIPEGGNSLTMFQHYVVEIIKALDTAKDVSWEDIALLEWAYLPWLRDTRRSPKALHRALAATPSFFLKVLSTVFPPSKESGIEEEPPTDLDKARDAASQAYSLLSSWKTLPGSKEDGSVDPADMAKWVTEARDLAKKAGRSAVADSKIGTIFSASPIDRDGAWPIVAVRQQIEAIRSESLDDGFCVGIRNRRGVTSRGPWDGGEQERAEAQRYRAWAKALQLEWPRTAAQLERIAESYEHDARREDQDAERNDW